MSRVLFLGEGRRISAAYVDRLAGVFREFGDDVVRPPVGLDAAGGVVCFSGATPGEVLELARRNARLKNPRRIALVGFTLLQRIQLRFAFTRRIQGAEGLRFFRGSRRFFLPGSEGKERIVRFIRGPNGHGKKRRSNGTRGAWMTSGRPRRAHK